VFSPQQRPTAVGAILLSAAAITDAADFCPALLRSYLSSYPLRTQAYQLPRLFYKPFLREWNVGYRMHTISPSGCACSMNERAPYS